MTMCAQADILNSNSGVLKWWVWAMVGLRQGHVGGTVKSAKNRNALMPIGGLRGRRPLWNRTRIQLECFAAAPDSQTWLSKWIVPETF